MKIKPINSEFLRSDFMIDRIAQAHKFWSDKERVKRRKKKQHVVMAVKQEDGTIKFL
jgi:hypothetical protein